MNPSSNGHGHDNQLNDPGDNGPPPMGFRVSPADVFTLIGFADQTDAAQGGTETRHIRCFLRQEHACGAFIAFYDLDKFEDLAKSMLLTVQQARAHQGPTLDLPSKRIVIPGQEN